MTGVLSGLKVLDLSHGVAGPMATMLMADHQARVTRVLPPDGDPFEDYSGSRVWRRGKDAVTLDLKDTADHATFLGLVDEADALVESFSPGVTARLGIDYETLSRRNPALIYVSITAYGRDAEDADRPGYDALVAARTGLQWEQRGWPEGCEQHMSRAEGFAPDIEIPYDWVQGPARPGPLFSASTWPSLGAFFGASLGFNAALRARGLTGRGQHVETSLLQGAMAAAWAVWQRADNPDAPDFETWVFGSRSPKGHFRCADGKWVHHWVPNPRFLITTSETDAEAASLNVHDDPDRFGFGPEELLVMMHYQEDLMERVGRFGSDYWINAAAAAKLPLQPCRPVEEALTDPLLLDDGCVIELDDPDLGPIRQVGAVYKLGACATRITGKVADATAAPSWPKVEDGARALASMAGKGPLAGVRVLDFGLAVAGPYGTQLLSDLGADVIKINTTYDSYWHRSSISFACNRGKRSIALNLKDPRAKEIVRKLVESCNIVQHNMRYAPATRLGIDYETLKAINPGLIYCHTLGFERGPARGAAGQRPDRRVPGRHPVRGRRRRQGGQADVGAHRLRRHRQRFPVGDRDGAGADPPRPDRGGSVPGDLDHLRIAAEHVFRLRLARWPRVGPPLDRRRSGGLPRAVPSVRDGPWLALRRGAGRPALAGAGKGGGAGTDRRRSALFDSRRAQRPTTRRW